MKFEEKTWAMKSYWIYIKNLKTETDEEKMLILSVKEKFLNGFQE
jgi:hypothetical protein